MLNLFVHVSMGLLVTLLLAITIALNADGRTQNETHHHSPIIHCCLRDRGSLQHIPQSLQLAFVLVAWMGCVEFVCRCLLGDRDLDEQN